MPSGSVLMTKVSSPAARRVARESVLPDPGCPRIRTLGGWSWSWYCIWVPLCDVPAPRCACIHPEAGLFPRLSRISLGAARYFKSKSVFISSLHLKLLTISNLDQSLPTSLHSSSCSNSPNAHVVTFGDDGRRTDVDIENEDHRELVHLVSRFEVKRRGNLLIVYAAPRLLLNAYAYSSRPLASKV